MTYFRTFFARLAQMLLQLSPSIRKFKKIFCVSAMMLFYFWRKYYLNKSCQFFFRDMLHHFMTLNWVSLKCNKFCCLHLCQSSFLNTRAVKLLESTQRVTPREWVWCRPLTFIWCRGEECVEPYHQFRNVLITWSLTKSEKFYLYY